MSPGNYDWMTDAKFEVPSPEMLRRRRFWIRIYLITAALSMAAGVFGCFFSN